MDYRAKLQKLCQNILLNELFWRDEDIKKMLGLSDIYAEAKENLGEIYRGDQGMKKL